MTLRVVIRSALHVNPAPAFSSSYTWRNQPALVTKFECIPLLGGLGNSKKGAEGTHSEPCVSERRGIKETNQRIAKARSITPAHQIKWVNIAYQGVIS